ncbi:hypothetical protein C4D60_Mb03t21300 [Musa balbisiana]|uniref:Uncharacterized protein n=1 Tax=Musa balbisiana TaxID=52838 RepID=A0A4S8JBH7_MUSBA|nr:hypothetical protein C4D60_Mb03t21300 [Musa balbisiana]
MKGTVIVLVEALQEERAIDVKNVIPSRPVETGDDKAGGSSGSLRRHSGAESTQQRCYNKEERWGSAGERNTRDAAAEGNKRWRRVVVEKTVALRRVGKIYRIDDLTTEKPW